MTELVPVYNKVKKVVELAGLHPLKDVTVKHKTFSTSVLD